MGLVNCVKNGKKIKNVLENLDFGTFFETPPPGGGGNPLFQYPGGGGGSIPILKKKQVAVHPGYKVRGTPSTAHLAIHYLL